MTIVSEGVDSLNFREVQEACRSRGMPVGDLAEREQRTRVRDVADHHRHPVDRGFIFFSFRSTSSRSSIRQYLQSLRFSMRCLRSPKPSRHSSR